jgi:hypothetical protein
VSTLDRRSVGELLADSDLLAREALLEMSANRALGMVREWPQLIKSAAELWAILPPEPTVSASGDPMAILAAMGSALRHRLAAGHWPGQGPTDESWQQIGANFTQARRLLQGQPVASEAISAPDQSGPTAANTQVLHPLARVIAMRAQGEAEVAIEQGETRFEGVRWVTPRQINAATDVVAATNQAVAAAAHLNPTEHASRAGVDRPRPVGRAAPDREIPIHRPYRGGPSR